MTLSELIKSVGDENVVYQNILLSHPRCQVLTAEHGEVTFRTDISKVGDLVDQQLFGGDGGEWVAFVVWMPKAKVDEVMS